MPQPLDPQRDLAAALHEVSNALTVLLGWADAARAMTDPREIAGALDIVTARASQARDIARQAIGAAPPPPPPSPVAGLVGDAALGLSVEARRAGVTILTRIDPDVAARELPSGPELSQILTNLLLNAIAFSPPGSTVHLTAGAAEGAGAGGAGDRVFLCVDDQGPGIPAEQRVQLFESGVSSRRGGAGIGLRHSAALAVQAGGELRLGQVAVGTRFELVWPLAPAEPSGPGAAPRSVERPIAAAAAAGAAVAVAVAGRPDGKGGGRAQGEARLDGAAVAIDGSRILVVEDDEAVIQLLELALEARGADVVSIKARADLPRALTTGRFDAALLDMSPLLGDVDGAVAELRRSSPNARLVVMSGSIPHTDVDGAAVWVRKPFEVREIVDALAKPARASQPPGGGGRSAGASAAGRAEAGRGEAGRTEVGRAEVGRAEVALAEIGKDGE